MTEPLDIDYRIFCTRPEPCPEPCGRCAGQVARVPEVAQRIVEDMLAFVEGNVIGEQTADDETLAKVLKAAQAANPYVVGAEWGDDDRTIIREIRA